VPASGLAVRRGEDCTRIAQNAPVSLALVNGAQPYTFREASAVSPISRPTVRLTTDLLRAPSGSGARGIPISTAKNRLQRAGVRIRGTAIAAFSAMSRHWKGIIGLFALTLIAFATAIVTQSVAAAILVLLLGLCLAFVLATAWMRPRGEPPERHAAHDRIVNDTNP